MSILRISFTNGVEFALDQHDNLSIARSNNWGVSKETVQTVHIGFLTPHLIDSMIENLNRLRPFAK